jgi:hypothetical protein
MNDLILWREWSKAIFELRLAFSRQLTFWWALIYCVGLTVRTNIRGTSSIVDALGLKSSSYDSLLRMCHSNAINLDLLTALWVKLCLKLFRLVCIDGYLVLFGDGIKVGKEGKKMPAVKLMHQSSHSNSKAEFIMGHYLQALSLAVTTATGRVASIPLIARIHDGIVFSNRGQKTSMNRFVDIVRAVVDSTSTWAIVVADAYYSNRVIIHELKAAGCHLVSRVAHNTAANFPAAEPTQPKRGRPRKKRQKVVIKELFGELQNCFGDYSYTVINLYWTPAKDLVRFVICEHATKGRIILMTTKLDLDPVTIIKMYEKRWLIETGFKTAIHQIGTFAYHFWMKAMQPIKRGQLKQYLHRTSSDYRNQIRRKMKAYHVHLALGCITQGLMLHLAVNYRNEVWASFNGWLRTIRKDLEPTEVVVSSALSSTLPNYLRAPGAKPEWLKFMKKNQNQRIQEAWKIAG